MLKVANNTSGLLTFDNTELKKKAEVYEMDPSDIQNEKGFLIHNIEGRAGKNYFMVADTEEEALEYAIGKGYISTEEEKYMISQYPQKSMRPELYEEGKLNKKAEGFNQWFDRFLEEKDLPFASWELEDDTGNLNMIDSEVVIEAIKNTSPDEQSGIKDMLVKLDFANADIMDYFKHLAMGLIKNASLNKKAEQKEEWSNWETMIVADWLEQDPDIQEQVIETIRERGEGIEDENFSKEIAEFLKGLFDDRNPITDLNAPAVYSDLLEGATSEINWDELAEKFILKASQTKPTVEDSSVVQEEGE